jgi:iron complex outermembrane receptor protein
MNFPTVCMRSTPRWLAIVSLAALMSMTGLARAETADPLNELGDASFPVVITPTRLRQSLADVPASVTVISGETLRRYGITSVPEALRLVPGMEVSRVKGDDYRVNYHGTNLASPRRLNVLIDGVSVYRPAYSRVEWSLLPVAMEDIDVIEVTRGPDSASYGPNSMMAVINILTKHPEDVERGLVSVSAGSHGTVDSVVRLSTQVGATSVRATLNVQRDSGYDRVDLPGGDRDSTNAKRLNVRAITELSDGSTLDLQGSVVDGLLQVGYVEDYQVTPADASVLETQWSARWSKSLSANHALQVDLYQARDAARQHWTTCWPQLVYWPEFTALYRTNQAYVVQMAAGNLFPRGGSAQDDQLASQLRQRIFANGMASYSKACGDANQDGVENRTQLEVQDTLVLSDQWRFATGFGMRYQRVDSQTYFNGAVGNHIRWAFGHAEYRPLSWLTANVGGYLEYNSLSGRTFSPRVALNARLSDQQTVRLVFSRGTRTPDIFEERAHWNFTVTGLTPAVDGRTSVSMFALAQAQGGLSSERIWARELGYLLHLNHVGLTLDARVFDEHLSDLISDRLIVSDFSPSNQARVRLTGAELQAQWDMSSAWAGHLSYAYVLNRDASKPVETSQYSRHSGSIGLTHAFAQDWRVSALVTAASGDGVNELRHLRTDLTVSRNFLLGSQRGEVSLGISYLDEPAVQTYRDATSYSTASYNHALGVRGGVRLAF